MKHNPFITVIMPDPRPARIAEMALTDKYLRQSLAKANERIGEMVDIIRDFDRDLLLDDNHIASRIIREANAEV